MRNEVKTNRLKAKLLGAAVGIFAVVSMGVTADAQGQDVLVIQGGTLVDGNGGAPVPNSVIVVTGNRITAAGRTGDVQVPAGAEVIDATGKWITPGDGRPRVGDHESAYRRAAPASTREQTNHELSPISLIRCG